MTVNKDPSGQRYVEVEVEVPGTPEQVWAAIATGQGVSAWFVPTTVDEHVGGKVTCNFGPGMESVSEIKEWSPPNKMVADSEEGPGTVATEWTVEARDGGVCVVKVLHRWFATTDDWDKEFEGHTQGWKSFFRMLRLYLANFPGQASSAIQVAGFSKEPIADVWQKLCRSLAIPDGEGKVTPVAGAPPLAGEIVVQGTGESSELLMKVEQPAPGLAHMFPMQMGDQVLVSVRFFLYGETGEKTVEHSEKEWSEWLAKMFPPVEANSSS